MNGILKSLSRKMGGETCCEIVGGNSFQYFQRMVKDSDTLVVLLPGAYERSKGPVQYQRYSWSEDFRCNVLAISDPTISVNNDLSLGWFQGVNSSNGIDDLHMFLEKYINDRSIKRENVLFFGSSAGGYVSLKMCEYFPRAMSVVINPQIYVDMYWAKYVDALFRCCYPDLKKIQVVRQFREKLQVKSKIAQHGPQRIWIYQNLKDDHHVNVHLNPFIESCQAKKLDIVNPAGETRVRKKSMVQVVYYNDDALKHTPPGRVQTIKMIRNFFVECFPEMESRFFHVKES